MLDKFWLAQNWEKLEKVNRWKVSRDGDRVIFELFAKDGEQYRVLLVCDNYPQQAPSVVFINNEGSKLDPKAWPKGKLLLAEIVKPPTNCFLCMELTREGLTHHAEWKSQEKSWHGERNTLLDIFNFLQRLLNSDSYGYECRGG